MATLQQSQSKSEAPDEVAGTPIYANPASSPFDRVAPSPFPVDELQSIQQSPSQHVPLGTTLTNSQSAAKADSSREQTPGSPPDYAYLSSQDDLSFSDKSILPGYDDQPSSAFYTANPKHPSLDSPSKQLSNDHIRENGSGNKKSELDLNSQTINPPADDSQTGIDSSESTEMDLARLIGRGRMHDQSSEFSVGKGKENFRTNEQLDGEAKNRELLDIWEKIERAHGTRLEDQSFSLLDDQVEDSRSESSTRRVQSNPPSFDRDPSEMITADQFIQENDPSPSINSATNNSSLTVESSTEQSLLVKTNSVSSKIAGMFGRKENSLS